MQVFEHLAPGRQLLFFASVQPQALGFKMHRNQDHEKVANCPKNGSDGDFCVRYIGHFCHHKRASSHDRRHDLPTHGRSRFDPSGKVALVAQFDHRWNGV